jgi:hypothetical protein
MSQQNLWNVVLFWRGAGVTLSLKSNPGWNVGQKDKTGRPHPASWSPDLDES